jgi:enoyl-CoA hydratase/carnithine racemase
VGAGAHLAEQPAISVRFAKQALSRAGSMSLDEALVLEAEGLLACMGTDDWSSGVDAFDVSPRAVGGE